MVLLSNPDTPVRDNQKRVRFADHLSPGHSNKFMLLWWCCCTVKHQQGGQNGEKNSLKVIAEDIQMICLFSSVTSCCWFWRISWFRGQTCALFWWVPPWMLNSSLSTSTPVQSSTYQVKTIHFYYHSFFYRFVSTTSSCKVFLSSRWGCIWCWRLRGRDWWGLGGRTWKCWHFCAVCIPAELPSPEDNHWCVHDMVPWDSFTTAEDSPLSLWQKDQWEDPAGCVHL